MTKILEDSNIAFHMSAVQESKFIRSARVAEKATHVGREVVRDLNNRVQLGAALTFAGVGLQEVGKGNVVELTAALVAFGLGVELAKSWYNGISKDKQLIYPLPNVRKILSSR